MAANQPNPASSDLIVATLLYSRRNHAVPPPAILPPTLTSAPAAAPDAPASAQRDGAYLSAPILDAFRAALSQAGPSSSDLSALTLRPLDHPLYPQVIEATFPAPTTTPTALRTHPAITTFEHTHHLELIFQRESIWRRHRRLAIFDMDSTLIAQEVIDEVAAQLGPDFQRQVSAITERAMNGELDFSASLRARCRLLAGVSSAVWEDIRPRITIAPGARALTAALKRLGLRLAVLSGGFMPLAGWLAGELGLDYFFANRLVVSEDGLTLTGELEGEIVHAERKALLTQEIAAKENVPLESVVCVGDGANDLKMMEVAGLGVAWKAKKLVQEQAPARVNGRDLWELLWLMGLTAQDLRELGVFDDA